MENTHNFYAENGDHRSYAATLQQRLSSVQDRLKRKLINNNLYLISDYVDVIRMKARKTFEGDDVSWVVDSTDVISVAFPPLTEVPYRKIQVDQKTKTWSLTSLISQHDDGEQEKNYTLSIPYNYDIDTDDLLFRIYLDDDIKWPIIIPLQIKALLGDFGGREIIAHKANATIPTENFPQEVIDAVAEMARRRLRIGF